MDLFVLIIQVNHTGLWDIVRLLVSLRYPGEAICRSCLGDTLQCSGILCGTFCTV